MRLGIPEELAVYLTFLSALELIKNDDEEYLPFLHRDLRGKLYTDGIIAYVDVTSFLIITPEVCWSRLCILLVGIRLAHNKTLRSRPTYYTLNVKT